jgi:hypothetical protein
MIRNTRTRKKSEKEYCNGCGKIYVNVVKHTQNCHKRFNNFIGPLPQQIQCQICRKKYYTSTHYRIVAYSKSDYYSYSVISYHDHLEDCSKGLTVEMIYNEEYYDKDFNLKIISKPVS